MLFKIFMYWLFIKKIILRKVRYYGFIIVYVLKNFNFLKSWFDLNFMIKVLLCNLKSYNELL